MMGSAAAAEDIAQDVFLSLLRHPGRFDPNRGNLRPCLLGLTRNLVLKRWRDEHQWEELLDEKVSANPTDLERREKAEIGGAAVFSPPPLQREVLILFEYEELS